MDPGEFRRWYETVAPDLQRYVGRITDTPDASEDLFQETFSRYLASGFDAEDPSERRRYLFRIATNLARDRQRWTRRWGLGALLDRGGESPEPGYGDRLDVQQALSRLPPRARALLWLAYAQGLAHDEIAEIVGVASTSVRVLLSRARKEFVRHLGRTDR